MKTILLGVTGSIACYKSCEIASSLTQKGYNVSAILTKGALEFIKPLTFRTLTDNPVYSDIFEEKMTHISLAQSADLIVVAPASASFISKLAQGLASDILTLTIISSSAPVLICPAMNELMYKNKITQSNIEKLKHYGYHFLGPYKGWLSCGLEGEGRLADVPDIVARIEKLVQ